MLTVVDIDNAMMEAGALVNQWEAEFQEAFYKPVFVAEAVQMFLGMGPEERDILKAMDPELYELCKARAQRLQQWLRPVAISAEMMGTGNAVRSAVPPYQPTNGPGTLAP